MSYVMPSLPAAALLLTYYQIRHPINRKWYALGLITPSLLIAVVVSLHTYLVDPLSDKALIETWRQQPKSTAADLLYLGRKSFSSQFYSQGKVQSRLKPVSQWLPSQTNSFFIIQPINQKAQLFSQSNWQCELKGTNTKRELVFCHPR